MRIDVGGRCPPAPPPTLSRPLSTIELSTSASRPLVRIHWEGKDPLAFAIAAKGNRFDPLGSPWNTTKVLYAGDSVEVAAAETVLRWHAQLEPGEVVSLSESAHLRDRRVARFKCGRPLKMIDASGLGLASIEKVVIETLRLSAAKAVANGPTPIAEDIFQCAPSDYGITQQWGAWFRSQQPKADGILWTSRQFNLGRCVVLFDDCCEDELEIIGTSLPLYAPGSSERRIMDDMLGKLGWGVET